MNEERIKERCKREDIALKIVKGFLKKDCYTDTELEYSLNTLLDLYNKQKEEIEYYKSELEKESSIWTKIEKGNDYISKDKVLKAIGYEENDEEYKRIYNKEELILSLIRTINEECDRLEDIEDQIDNMRDNYWEDKIRKTLLKFQNEYGEDLETTDQLFIGKEVIQYGEDMLDEIAKELNIDLLEEK